MNEQITLTVFTDPMMGLSYESQPILDRLKVEYGERLQIDYVMSVLVRDVSDFMTLEERVLPPEEGIRRYNQRLAGIYKSEESIGSLPMNMENFHLFDPDHRSSYPLCLAYHAAKLTAPEKEEQFLINLRKATVLQGRITTHQEVILEIVKETGVDENTFIIHFRDGSAESALEKDRLLAQRLGVHALPAYLLTYQKSSFLLPFLTEFSTFSSAIDQMLKKKNHKITTAIGSRS
ncbi:MAG: DsbA family protein [Clostridia bacterium]|nr:DsbA family protein [Clostridia bacterium]